MFQPPYSNRDFFHLGVYSALPKKWVGLVWRCFHLKFILQGCKAVGFRGPGLNRLLPSPGPHQPLLWYIVKPSGVTKTNKLMSIDGTSHYYRSPGRWCMRFAQDWRTFQRDARLGLASHVTLSQSACSMSHCIWRPTPLRTSTTSAWSTVSWASGRLPTPFRQRWRPSRSGQISKTIPLYLSLVLFRSWVTFSRFNAKLNACQSEQENSYDGSVIKQFGNGTECSYEPNLVVKLILIFITVDSQTYHEASWVMSSKICETKKVNLPILILTYTAIFRLYLGWYRYCNQLFA